MQKKDTLKDKTIEEDAYFKKETQTERYYYALSSPELRKIPPPPTPDIQFFIFLAGKQKPTEEKFIKVTYQDLVDYIIEPQLKNGLDDYSNFILNDYLKNLSGNPYNEKLSTMAIPSNEKELLLSFYKKNENLFILILQAKAEFAEDEDEKELIKNAITSLNAAKKKRRYTIFYDGKTFENLMMYEVLEHFTNFRLSKDKKITEIDEELKGYAGENKGIVSDSQNKVYGYDRYYHKFTFDGRTYFITKELKGDEEGNFRKIKDSINDKYHESFRITDL